MGNWSFSYSTGSDYPANAMSWRNAATFCNNLFALLGLEKVYDESSWEADFTKNGFYLPTEAQWEYAAGGPNHFSWSLGDTFVGTDYAFNGNTCRVKDHPANGFDLHEMSGSYWEWCHDRQGGSYP